MEVFQMNEKKQEKKEHEKDNPDLEEQDTREEPLPYCTSAPSAEHHRSGADDIEPCDDARGTEFEWEKAEKSKDGKKDQPQENP